MTNVLTAEPIAGTGIRLGVTLYSFSNEWVENVYSLESLVKRVAETGIGPGVEIVGFQSIRTFPEVSDEFVSAWRGLLDQYGLVGSCLGSNIDVALRRDRLLTTDEMVDYLSRQIVTARRLSFPVVRIQMGATSEVIERVAPIAEKAGIVLGMEIHAPESGRSAETQRVLAAYERIGSPNLGFIPDFSSTMHRIPQGMLDLFGRNGVSAEQLDRLQAIWAKDTAPSERYAEWREGAEAAGTPDEALNRVQLAFTMFGHEPIETWKPIADRIVHVHGKFYEIDGDGNEPNIDYRAAMKMLVDADYNGFISSEWEGHGFHDVGEVDPAELVSAQHTLERAAIIESSSAAATPGS